MVALVGGSQEPLCDDDPVISIESDISRARTKDTGRRRPSEIDDVDAEDALPCIMFPEFFRLTCEPTSIMAISDLQQVRFK